MSVLSLGQTNNTPCPEGYYCIPKAQGRVIDKGLLKYDLLKKDYKELFAQYERQKELIANYAQTVEIYQQKVEYADSIISLSGQELELTKKQFELEKQAIKRKRFGIGPMVGFGYSFSDTTPRLGVFVGIGLSYNIIRL